MFQHLLDLLAQLPRGPPKVGLQDLTHIHSGWNAQGIQHDVDRGAVREEGHILFRQNPGDDPLVPMAPRHLISHRELPFHGQIDLHRLQNAGRQLFSPGDLRNAPLVKDPDSIDLILHLIQHGPDPNGIHLLRLEFLKIPYVNSFQDLLR